MGEVRVIAELAEAVDALAAALARARVVLPFTGAGISTESGVPDFRSPGSPWLANKPIPFQAFLASDEARREAWRRKFVMDELYAGAQPGRGHRALTTLVRAGQAPAIITQNIDGLHQAAGLSGDEVVELHGNGTYAACLACGRRHELTFVRTVFAATGEPPACTACGGHLKSATISFGQAMPEEPMRRATLLAGACDLFLAIGSSLVVMPAAGFPVIARRAGACLIIINREPTDLDPMAELVIRADIGAVLEGAVGRHLAAA